CNGLLPLSRPSIAGSTWASRTERDIFLLSRRVGAESRPAVLRMSQQGVTTRPVRAPRDQGPIPRLRLRDYGQCRAIVQARTPMPTTPSTLHRVPRRLAAAGLVSLALLPGMVWSATPANPGVDAPAAAGKRPRICLVLSGGGARGAAHVGVLRVLEEMH